MGGIKMEQKKDKFDFDHIFKRPGKSSDYFYEFGAYEPDYSLPLSKDLEEIDKKIKAQIQQLKLKSLKDKAR